MEKILLTHCRSHRCVTLHCGRSWRRRVALLCERIFFAHLYLASQRFPSVPMRRSTDVFNGLNITHTLLSIFLWNFHFALSTITFHIAKFPRCTTLYFHFLCLFHCWSPQWVVSTLVVNFLLEFLENSHLVTPLTLTLHLLQNDLWKSGYSPTFFMI